MEKYKTLLFAKIEDQLASWFDIHEQKTIPNEEVFRFLHSIKGTSGTIQLGGLLQVSSNLLNMIEENNEKAWEVEELRDFLSELIDLTAQYEHFQKAAVTKPQGSTNDNVPLVQIIDDDVSMLILLKDALEEKGWMVIANNEPEKAVSQYFDMHPDCLIIDANLPTKTEFQLLMNIQQHNEKQFIPKIITSIQNDRVTRLKAYKMGADDFIVKTTDFEELIIRVERQLQRKKLFDESVLIDELTQVYNRRFLDDLFERNLNEIKRTNIPFSIAILDIDHFKMVNDTYGHAMGDKVLYDFASYLKGHVRSSDTVFRLGGEEFVILFPGVKDAETKVILNRLLKQFSQRTFHANGQAFHITFSAGIFTITNPNIDQKLALKTADHALYNAKAAGRNRIESASQTNPELNKKNLVVSIVDDDSIIRTMLVRVIRAMKLEDLTLDIEAFSDGQQLFDSKRLELNEKHFLILDGIMPVMDGLEVLQKVKQGKNAERIHVLMLTGRKSEYDIARALKLGADDYMTKPFSITELQARIQRLIQRVK